MSIYRRILLVLLLTAGVTTAGYLWGYHHGKQATTDLVAAHARVYGSIQMASEIVSKVGYKSNGSSSEDMKVLEFTDIKHFRYYIVEVNGVKTVAAHEMEEY